MSDPLAILVASLSPALRELGFKKRGYRFCLVRNNCALVVELQESRERYDEELVGCYVNVGVCSLAIIRFLYPDVSTEWPSEMYAQIRDRVRHGPGFNGELWRFSATCPDKSRIEEVSDRVLRMIEAKLPLLDEEPMMAALEDQADISALERLESLAILAGRARKLEAQRRYLERVRDAFDRTGMSHAFAEFESRALALAKS